jgi:hypothetical protein
MPAVGSLLDASLSTTFSTSLASETLMIKCSVLGAS